MKNLVNLLSLTLLTMVLLVLSFSSCQKEYVNEETPKVDTQSDIIDGEFSNANYQKRMRFPELVTIENQANNMPVNTKITRIDESLVSFEFPTNTYYFYNDDKGNLKHTSKKCFKCTCTGSGCDVHYDGQFHCGPCTSDCIGQHVTCNQSQKIPSDGVYLDFNIKSGFITKGKYTENLLQPTEVFYQIPEVISFYEKLNLQYYGTRAPNLEKIGLDDDDYKIVPLNIYGVISAYLLPVEFAYRGPEYQDVSCRCSDAAEGIGDCRPHRHFSYVVCEQIDCISCIMQVGNSQ